MNQSLFTPGCIHCGSFLVDVSLFCETCFYHLIKPKIEEFNFNVPARHVYLIRWHKADDMILSQLVYRLKSSQSPQALKYYSKLLAAKMIHNFDMKNYDAIVPVPGSSEQRIHSNLIAQSLGEITGFSVMRLLERTPFAKQQKALSSHERKLHNPFRLNPKIHEDFTTEPGVFKPYIFVDDVLTTGQSIKHAESLLSPGKRNAVATLFYRPPQ